MTEWLGLCWPPGRVRANAAPALALGDGNLSVPVPAAPVPSSPKLIELERIGSVEPHLHDDA